MRLFALLALGACGRIGFDATASGDSDVQIAYDDVRAVYITSHPMTLVPRVIGSPDVWAVTPDLPAGVTLDVSTGVIDGTPTAESAPTDYTITADAASTQIRLRFADGYIVNDTGDGVDTMTGDRICDVAAGTGRCTLRAAVGEINADGGDHSVIFIEPLTIVLGSMLPPAMQNIEVVGCSPDTTIVDSNAVAPLTQFGTNDVTLTLSHLTYRNGLGPIEHNFQSNLRFVIEHAKLLGNSDLVKVASSADLLIRDSWFEGNTGTVVYFSGSATIERSTFANNTGNIDGMLYFVSGTATISDSTFSGNAGDFSTIVLNNTTAVFANNTFANNSSTSSFMGGAITGFSGSTSTLSNNLLVANTGTDDGSCRFTGAMTSGGGNLVFPADVVGGTCQLNAAIDHASIDPLLEPLARNGAQIPTHALPADSPAVDSGVAAGCTPTDGRGIPRPQGNACDIGAFERE